MRAGELHKGHEPLLSGGEVDRVSPNQVRCSLAARDVPTRASPRARAASPHRREARLARTNVTHDRTINEECREVNGQACENRVLSQVARTLFAGVNPTWIDGRGGSAYFGRATQ